MIIQFFGYIWPFRPIIIPCLAISDQIWLIFGDFFIIFRRYLTLILAIYDRMKLS